MRAQTDSPNNNAMGSIASGSESAGGTAGEGKGEREKRLQLQVMARFKAMEEGKREKGNEPGSPDSVAAVVDMDGGRETGPSLWVLPEDDGQ